MYGSQKVILPVIQYIIIDGNTRSYQFRNTPLHQFLGHFRVFQLVTDRHTLSGTYQFRQIRIQCMMRESRHFNSLSFTIGTLSQGNSQDFGCNNSISRISFIEVAATKQHNGIRMLGFQVQELFHHRGKDNIFFAHSSCSL